MPFFLVDVSISVSDFLRPTCSNTMPCLIYFSLFFSGALVTKAKKDSLISSGKSEI